MRIVPEPSTESLLLASFDSQRYDLSKRRKLSPQPTLMENEIADGRNPGHAEELSEKQSSPETYSLLRDRGAQVDQTGALASEGNNASHPNRLKISDPQCADNSRAALPSSTDQSTYHQHDCSLSKHIAELFRRQERIHTIDIYEKEDGETVRTVIRPFKPTETSRPSSPVNSIFSRLDCTCCTDAFEDDLDFVQDQREKRIAGVTPNLEISVKKKSTLTREEKWRDAVQAILYECRGYSASDSVFGRVEVC